MEDWIRLSETFKYLTARDISFFKEELFKRNAVNYQWTKQEDQLLQSLILKNKKATCKLSPGWLQISNEFNQFPFISQIRTAAHCQERWKNTLKTKFLKGNWDKKDDEKIIGFVMRSGTKWSKLAKGFNGRTEHNLKNRFFSILSRELGKPIREIKSKMDYRSKKVLGKVRKMLRSGGQNIE